MALPTILINSSSGSDSAASGAGPGTALTGSSGVSDGAGTVVTLDGSPNLTGVATDGSAVLYFADATAGNRNFAKITAADNVGKTVTLANAVGASLTKAWAIGGKRASLLSATSLKLTNNNGAAGDAKAGWVLEMESGHAETRSSRWDVYSPGDTTSGPLVIRGASGAAARPVITFNGSDIVPRVAYVVYKDFDLAGAGGATACFTDVASYNRYEGLKISGFSTVLINSSGGGPLASVHVVGCELSGGTVAVKAYQNAHVLFNYIHGGSSHGISSDGANTLSGLIIHGNVIAGMGGDGVNLNQTRQDAYSSVVISHNTIDSSTGDGIDYTGDGDGLTGVSVFNNVLSNNGGYGLNFTSLTAAKVLARGTLVKNNNTYNNTSGDCNLAGVLEGDPGLNPTFTNAAGGDYSVGVNLRAKAYPAGGTVKVGSTGATDSYADVGAAQRREPSAAASRFIQAAGSY